MSIVVALKSPKKKSVQTEFGPEDALDIVKLEKALGQEAVSAIQDMDYQELREHIVTLSEHEEETTRALKRDSEIRELKAQISEMQAPYKETLKGVKARRTLAVLLMQQRGKPLSKAKGSTGGSHG